MTWYAFLGVAVAGGLGAALRLLIDGVVRSRTRVPFPIGTMVVNLAGSLALGVVAALATTTMLAADWRAVIGTGLLGGFTTFSTASFETVRLIQERRPVAAIVNGLGMLVGCVALAALGWAAGSALARALGAG